ncbi:ETX/MTX2 family pore-forming toxin [Streptomyces sp. NPDC047028]|uniref:ETX/MTX2 family pore-forming toxin n=1 Tax=Streptomyces sp. NPDC047028 TaxID=3155793 RepID=UPI0033C7AC90
MGFAIKPFILPVTCFVMLAAVPMTTGRAHADPVTWVDLDAVTRVQAVYWADAQQYEGKVVRQNNSRIAALNAKIGVVGDPVISEAGTLYIGGTSLENSSDVEQTLTTQAFSQSESDTLSTSVARGLSGTVKVAAKFLPGMDSEMSTTVSYSETNTQTESIAQTYTAPSQNIKVPARTVANVSVTLQRVTADGQMYLDADLQGKGDYSVNVTDRKHGVSFTNNYENVPIEDVLGPTTQFKTPKSGAPALPDGLTINSSNGVHFSGLGTYRATYGTRMYVKVNFVPTDGSDDSRSRQPLTYSISAS